MKTPEEIKKGLKCCARLKFPNAYCDGCPYLVKVAAHLWECKSPEILTDALIYIQQLESMAQHENLIEVVHCKDCEYWGPSPFVPYRYPEIGWCMIGGCNKRPDYYCASGKRRETNEKGDNNGIQETGANSADS